MDKRLEEIYQWSSTLTLEQSFTDVRSYLWTQETKALLNRLGLLKGQLIAVTGLQGSGKSILKDRLASTLAEELGWRQVLSVKWESEESLLKEFRPRIERQDVCDNLLSDLQSRLGFNDAHRWIAKHFHGHEYSLRKGECSEDLMSAGFIEAARKKLGYKDTLPPLDKLIELAKCKALLIEFPDYSKRTLALFNKHLADFQNFWEHLRKIGRESGVGTGGRPFDLNIILFFQKEMFQGHFLFRKFSHFDIRRFTPQELYNYYVQRFKEPEPFTEKALLEIASLARGIFRRFKNYILICIERSDPKQSITFKQVKQWIGLDQLTKDMELELYDLFPRSKENRRNSVVLMQFLREHDGEASQKEITEKLDVTKQSASRLIRKLEAYGYVRIQRKGRAHLIQLVDHPKYAPCSL